MFMKFYFKSNHALGRKFINNNISHRLFNGYGIDTTGIWLLSREVANYLFSPKKKINMVIMGAFRCIAINKFTEKPRFIHDKKKVDSMYT